MGVRQSARSDEMESLSQAKAMLEVGWAARARLRLGDIGDTPGNDKREMDTRQIRRQATAIVTMGMEQKLQKPDSRMSDHRSLNLRLVTRASNLSLTTINFIFQNHLKR